MHLLKKLAVRGGAFVLAVSVPLSTMAQIEEIVVTAQRREASAQDTPIAINALSGDQLDDYGVIGADDLEQSFVGITTNNSGAVNAGISIRGVGTSSFHVSSQQSVAVYIDNIYQISPFTSAIAAFDMERLEVLRGPQNTLYGRNTTGGAINFYSRSAQVGEEANGYARVTGGSGGTLNFEGAFGGSLGENVAGRIAVTSNAYDGILTAINDGEPTDTRNSSGFRASLTWEPTETFSVMAKFSSGSADGKDAALMVDGPYSADGTVDCRPAMGALSGRCPDYDSYAFNPGPNDRTVSYIQAAVNATPYLAELDRAGQLLPHPGMAGRKLFAPGGHMYNDLGDGYEFDYNIFNLYLTGQAGPIEITSITSKLDQFYSHYASGTILSFNANQLGDWDVLQQEVRFSSPAENRIRWVGGIYYSSSDSIEDTWVNIPNLPPSPSNSILIDAEFQAQSIYSQFDFDLSEDLTLTLGMRSSDEELGAPPTDGRYGYRKFFCHPAFGGMGTGNTSANIGRDFGREFRENNPNWCPEIQLGWDENTPPAVREVLFERATGPSQSLSEIGWNAILSWNPQDNMLLYASLGRGFKGGALDNRALANGDNPISPEYLDSVELGVKSLLADGRVQFNAAWYDYAWQDIQLFEVFPGPPPLGGPQLNNITEASSSGVELDVTLVPTGGLYVNLQALFADAEVTDISGVCRPEIVQCLTAAQPGKSFEGNPNLTYNGTITYTMPVGNGEVTLMGRYRFIESHFTALSNSVRDTIPDLGLLNLRATYNFGADQEYSVALYGNNVTGELICQGMANGPGPGAESFGCTVDRNANGNTLWGLSFEANF
ncbi:MAG: TonB-dependent receptor [Rhodospirillaceae bacterium]|nr:TonB-dependent receptor [Rhodospirillaceae bacterium]